MARHRSTDPKHDALREQGALNPRPEMVTDEVFLAHAFFDPRDLVQVKYEMLRRVRLEGRSVTQAAQAFGFSRLSFYLARAAFEQEGLAGLLPKKRGPRGPHKLSPEILTFARQVRAEDLSLRSFDLVEKIEQRFGVRVHPRTIERALALGEKKRR
jgi:transposase